MSQSLYKAKEFKLSRLKGISDRTLEMHLSLYEGYVKNTNALTEKLAEMTHKKKASTKDLAFAELTRRLGFEYDGMVLHEYYFDNLTPNGKGIISDETKNAIEKNFTTFENWTADFAAINELKKID